MIVASPVGGSFGGFGFGYGFGAAKSSPVVARLQRALALLAMATGDSKLAVKADGITGPATAAAVNRAFTTYISSAPAAYRTGKLTAATVGAQAAALSALVEGEVSRRGTGTKPAAVAKTVVKKAATAVTKAVTQAALQKVAAAKPAAKAAATAAAVKAVQSTLAPKTVAVKAKPTPVPAVTRLQHTLVSLGQQTGNKALSVAVDGLIGPKTTAAANLALKSYTPGAAASLRTGKLTQAQVLANAGVIADLVEAQVTVRSQKAAVAAKKAPAPAKAAAAARAAAAPTATAPGEEAEPEVMVPQAPMAPAPTTAMVPAVTQRMPALEPPDQVTPSVPAEAKPFPWLLVGGISAGVLAVGTTIFLVSRGGSSRGRRYRRAYA